MDAHGIHVANPGQTISIRGSDGTTREHSIAGRLLVPLRNTDGEIRNLQVIAADGTKLYLQGAQKIGTIHILASWGGGRQVGQSASRKGMPRPPRGTGPRTCRLPWPWTPAT